MSVALENMPYNALLEVAKRQESSIRDLQSQIGDMESQLGEMQFQLEQMKRLLFGAKRERFVKKQDENQMTLPFEVEQAEEPGKEKEEITYTREKKKRENHPGRLALPSHLPVKEIVLEPEQDTTGMKCIGKEITDQLEYTPAKLHINRYIRPKYITPQDEHLNQQGIIATLPTFPIEKGIAGAGLLAQITIDKFVDHMPIYRQIERFKRDEIRISSSTINGWQESVCNLLSPLFDTLKHRVLSQGYLQVTKPPYRCWTRPKKERHTGDIIGYITVRWKRWYFLIIAMAGQGRDQRNCSKISPGTCRQMDIKYMIFSRT